MLEAVDTIQTSVLMVLLHLGFVQGCTESLGKLFSWFVFSTLAQLWAQK